MKMPFSSIGGILILCVSATLQAQDAVTLEFKPESVKFVPGLPIPCTLKLSNHSDDDQKVRRPDFRSTSREVAWKLNQKGEDEDLNLVEQLRATPVVANGGPIAVRSIAAGESVEFSFMVPTNADPQIEEGDLFQLSMAALVTAYSGGKDRQVTGSGNVELQAEKSDEQRLIDEVDALLAKGLRKGGVSKARELIYQISLIDHPYAVDSLIECFPIQDEHIQAYALEILYGLNEKGRSFVEEARRNSSYDPLPLGAGRLTPVPD